MISRIWEDFGIPILIVGVSMYFYYRVAIRKEIQMVRGRDKKPLNPEKTAEYASKAGKLLIIFALGAAVMGVLTIFSPTAALLEVVAVTAMEAVLWKKLNERYEK